jgi:hypothetical protein
MDEPAIYPCPQQCAFGRAIVAEMEELLIEVELLRQMTDARGKPCPVCTSPMIDLRSHDSRLCINGSCQHSEPWTLKPGQAPLITSNRDTRRDA